MTEFCQRVVAAKWFQPLIVGVILAAGVLVGLETYPELVRRFGATFQWLDRVVLGIFVMEIALKLGAQSPQPWRFFRDPWNVFDFAVVAVCLLPLNGHYLAVLRLARILRVLRLVTTLPRLQLLVGALLKSLPSMGYVGLLLLLLFYIYAVMGTFLFGANDPMHFGSLQTALLSLFRIVTLEDWTDVMYIQMLGSANYGIEGFAGVAQSRAMPVVGALYFVSFVLLGTMVMLNLFIGVVVNGMHETQREQEMTERRQHLDQLGHLTLGDEMKLIEHELDKLKEQMQALRLRAERGPEREIHAGHRLSAGAPALPETLKPPRP